uniref:Uncharacterized protein n=1 Tax=Escherichia coli TaxID=562 RepID=A0A0E3H111_ECOLX|nr:hypothetical protein [Escherichia coli]
MFIFIELMIFVASSANGPVTWIGSLLAKEAVTIILWPCIR